MPAIRPRVLDVIAALQPMLHRDSEDAAKGNRFISQVEQKAAAPHVQQSAAELRQHASRVTVDDVDAALLQKAQSLIASVNQSSGSGAAFLSLAEAQRAAAQDPALGGRVLKAYEVAAHKSVDVDGIARARVKRNLEGNPGAFFRTFGSESEAENFRGPSGKSIYWLVVDSETSASKSYTQGTNDLWSVRFDVSKIDGAVTITAEH